MVERISWYVKSLDEDEPGQHLLSIPCVDLLTASLLSTQPGDGKQYGNYRDFAAATGLVPRQYSSEGRTAQQGISKWGNKSLRALQVQCAHVYSEDAGAPDRQAYRQYWCCKNGSDHRFLSMNSSAAVAPGIPWPFIRNGVFSSESS